MILHIPEYYADDFYNDLTEKDIEFLKSIKKLHINIMNQNIELMPEPEKLKDLYKLTNNITQTIAHDRYATQEEQQILAEYVGWGGLADAFDPQNDGWSEEYKELKSLLTEKEYSEARQSTLTAFYTPPVVISSIYKALEKMGLEKGNILEPSCRSW